MHFPAFNVASLARPLLSLTQASAPLDAGWPWSPSTALPQISLSILQLLAVPLHLSSRAVVNVCSSLRTQSQFSPSTITK